jgi:hypothetical protein
MRNYKFAVAIAGLGLTTSPLMAAVRPAAMPSLTLASMPMVAGARMGVSTSRNRSNVAGAGAGFIIAGVATAGFAAAIADAAGAFKDDDHHLTPTSP